MKLKFEAAMKNKFTQILETQSLNYSIKYKSKLFSDPERYYGMLLEKRMALYFFG